MGAGDPQKPQTLTLSGDIGGDSILKRHTLNGDSIMKKHTFQSSPSNPNSYSAKSKDGYTCTGFGVRLGVISLFGGCSESYKMLQAPLNW